MTDRIARNRIIQGGMGVGVSNYELARTVGRAGQLGVVSGTALGTLMVRRLQNGDPGGITRAALETFPNQEVVDYVLKRYFKEGGKAPDEPYRGHSFPALAFDGEWVRMPPELEALCVVASYVEVHLAKQGHDQPIGINLLHKIEWPTLPILYGAMLAGVDVVLMGAGIPREMPGILDAFAVGESASMSLTIREGEGRLLFEAGNGWGPSPDHRPFFLGIVGNHLGVKALPNADGYVLEGPAAGGHNAPARSKGLDETGQPNYGKKDETHFGLLRGMLERNGRNQPFWLAGGFASRLNDALELGAAGVQVGTPFALSRESGLTPECRAQAVEYIATGGAVFTDPLASPSGFPFKTLAVDDSVSCSATYDKRKRRCDLGYLLEFYKDEKTGRLASRCPSEPVAQYVRKGGDEANTAGRVCLCNGLSATVGIGMPQEPPLFTLGADLSVVHALLDSLGPDYGAEDVIRYILASAESDRESVS